MIMDNDLKKRIVEKAAELYNRLGIRSITMDDVSRELGISKKTLYQYISDKKHLVQEVCEMEMQKRRRAFEEIRGGGLNAIEEIFEVNKLVLKLIKSYNPTKFFDLKKHYPDIYRKIREGQRENMFRSMVANIRKGKAEGLFREDVDEEVIAKLYMSHTEYAMESDLLTPEEFTSPRFIIQAFLYHVHGIVNDRGKELIDKYFKQMKENDDHYELS